ncbi:MAG: 8-amino-7-oxononanoate synthase [Steroidobacteraceae bacterium]
MSWERFVEGELEALRKADRWRECIAVETHGPEGAIDGKAVISFSSNDYLGLSQHPALRHAAHAAIDRYGTSAAASRLIGGTRELHLELEQTIAQWQNTAAAIVFPTGFAANLGVLSTLGAADVTVFSDELNHASIIDGCRLSKAQVQVYRHVDMDHLAALMRAAPARKIVVTDSVFSMDGDTAPLADLAQLCAREGALLVVDEAHAVLGPDLGHTDAEVLRVGTLSKTLGSQGGWVAGSRALIQLLVNRARSFVFTTGLAPADAAAGLAAVRIMMSPEGEALRARLRSYVERVKPSHPSPIIPIIIGADAAALRAAADLLAQGLYVPAVRPPTVPRGTARLRVTVSAAHTSEMIDRLLRALGPHLHGSTGSPRTEQ